MAERPCYYCHGGVLHVALCIDCRGKLERAREDLKWYRNQAARERSNFFRLSKENIRLKQEIAALVKARVKR